MAKWQDLTRFEHLGAYDELGTDGRAGEKTRMALDLAVLNIGERRGFLPPVPHAIWTWHMASHIAVHVFEASRTGFLMGCWARSHDDLSLGLVLIDELEARLEAAAIGWTVSTVADQLDAAVLPWDATLHCSHIEYDVAVWSAPTERRHRGVWTATTYQVENVAAILSRIPVERATTGNQPVLATLSNLTVLARAVLDAADGQEVRLPDIAYLVHRALNASLRQERKPVLTNRFAEGAVGAPLDGPESELLVRDTAEQLWRTLTPAQRALVPHLGGSANELAAVAGTSVEAADAAAARLVAELRRACADDRDAADVLLTLRELCNQRP